MLFTSTSILVLVSLISIARVNAECIGVGAHPLTVTKRNIHADSDPSLGRDSYVDVSDLHKRQAAEAATAYFCGTLTGPMVADPVVLPTVGNYILSWAGVVGSGCKPPPFLLPAKALTQDPKPAHSLLTEHPESEWEEPY